LVSKEYGVTTQRPLIWILILLEIYIHVSAALSAVHIEYGAGLGPRNRLDAVKKKKFFFYRESNPYPAHIVTDYSTPTPKEAMTIFISELS
jgi:hypothetical protein